MIVIYRSSIEIAENLTLIYSDDNEVTGIHKHYPHTHTYCELYFYIDGKCSYMVENGVFDMPYGTVICTRPGELHCVQINEPCEYKRYYYEIPANALEFLGSEHMRCFMKRPFGEHNSLVLPVDIMNECESKLRRDVELYESGSSDYRSVALADLLYILHAVNTCFDDPVTNLSETRLNTIVSDALAYINSHLGEIRSTADIADALYVSREYLSRTFTRFMNITLTKYITTKRIELAKNLLSGGSSPSEAAENCGFNDYSYFIQVFRREVGITPYLYKIKMKSENPHGC